MGYALFTEIIIYASNFTRAAPGTLSLFKIFGDHEYFPS